MRRSFSTCLGFVWLFILLCGGLIGCQQKVPRSCKHTNDCKSMAPSIFCHQGICSSRHCEAGTQEPCYDGPQGTAGQGPCRQGIRSCLENGRWSACIGQILPTQEICDRIDNDCNGIIDTDAKESCDCYPPGAKRSCYPGPENTLGRSACSAGSQYCEMDNRWGACVGALLPQPERCDGLDNDCNGQIDDHPSCTCKDGDTRPCYTGPPKTRQIGRCKDGTQTCQQGQWGACIGEILPTTEDCKTSDIDDDCDGQINNGCQNNTPCPAQTPHTCGGVCVNIQSNTHHCGQCDQACLSNQSCEQGICVCPSGQQICGGLCVAVSSHAKHCGACDKSCPTGQSCCAGQCVDLNHTLEHCGACHQFCTGGQCIQGQCLPKCSGSLALCDNRCVDTSVDAKHCGACGNVCASGTPCLQGTCGCTTPNKLCAGVCFNMSSHPNHCGACGISCSGGQICSQGKCTCSEGKSLCQSVCIDTQQNIHHCGACGKTCPTGQFCTQGKCTVCPVGAKVCAKTGDCCPAPNVCHPTTDVCINLQQDSAHCGVINKSCDVTEHCVGGVCQCVSGLQRPCFPSHLTANRGKGLCRDGIQTCVNGTWDNQNCSGAIVPVAEICDALDNDCDGSVDNNVVIDPNSVRCKNLHGVCINVKEVCRNGKLECDVQNATDYESPEVSCDGKDNDCDGQVDEFPEVRSNCLNTTGVCGQGFRRCNNGVWSDCIALHYETVETRCDGRDNDCNGQIDEGGICDLPVAHQRQFIPTRITNDQIHALATHPLLDLAVIGTRSNRALLWKPSTGQESLELRGSSGNAHTKSVRCAAFSPDGKIVATGGDDQLVHLWDVTTGQLLQTLTPQATHLGIHASLLGVIHLAFHPSQPELLVAYGTQLNAVASRDLVYKGLALRWHYAQGKVLSTPISLDHAGGVRSVAFDPQGQFALTAGFDGLIKVWELQSWQSTRTLSHTHTPASKNPYGVSLSIREGQLATAGDDGLIHIWNTKTWTITHTFQTPLGGVTSLLWRQKGDVVISLSDSDLALRFWDLATKTLRRVSFGSQWNLLQIAESYDGSTLLTTTSSAEGVRVWGAVSSCFARSSSSVFAASFSSLSSKHTSPITQLEVSTNGAYLLTAARAQKVLKLWKLSNISHVRDDTWPSLPTDISGAAFFPQPGGAFDLVWGAGDISGRVMYWPLFGTMTLNTTPQRPKPVEDLRFNPSNFMLTLAEGSNVTLWNRYLPPLDVVLTVLNHDTNLTVKHVSWSADGTHLAAVLSNNSVQIWKINFTQNRVNGSYVVTGTAIGSPKTVSPAVTSLSWHPEKLWLAVATGSRAVQFWEIRATSVVDKTSTSGGGITTSDAHSAAFDPTGNHILIGFAKGELLLFSLYDSNGNLAPSYLKSVSTTNFQHINTVSLLSWSPGGDFFVSSGADQQLLVWRCVP